MPAPEHRIYRCSICTGTGEKTHARTNVVCPVLSFKSTGSHVVPLGQLVSLQHTSMQIRSALSQMPPRHSLEALHACPETFVAALAMQDGTTDAMLSPAVFTYPVVRLGPLTVQLRPLPQSLFEQQGSTQTPLRHAAAPARQRLEDEQLCPVVRVALMLTSKRHMLHRYEPMMNGPDVSGLS